MLDQETKRRINSCRDILVGKLTNPFSQVEQITIALIYKFMDDMDREAVEMGGKASFFSGEYEKYSWSNIFDPRIGGYELTKLYGKALELMNQNPNIPQLFRDIFKNAYLPYRDPETLKMFLKEINNFNYSHSEKLGDAFEYLLSFLGTQGNAGQFRTPRHIIDFITDVVQPKKNETVLDPACGTAGFLISAYKYIMKYNDNGKKLTPTEKKRLLANFSGYEIDPLMTKLSEVNMYLHGFKDPKIVEYDTLTSEERWNKTADVILANPPFMTPKGGIRPHKRFSIQAKRSEVLFVDYIAEHLNPSGRAGVIVPEGIIFQSSNAYKALRKMLVEDYLWAVVSLPQGVFNPYSGVKTSILLMDKTKAKQNDSILFVKVENDGFDLGAQRIPIDKNDLPEALKILQSGDADNTEIAHWVEKSKVAESGDWNLSGERYKESLVVNTDYEVVAIGDIVKLVKDKPEKFEDHKRYFSTGAIKGSGHSKDYQLVDMSNKPSRANILPIKTDIGFAKMKNTNKTVLIDSYYDGSIFSTGFAFLRVGKNILSKFLYAIISDDKFQEIKDNLAVDGIMGGIRQSDILQIQVPLPPLSVQEEIVAEIDGYQKIIDGARQVVDNYKPTIKISPDWEMVKLGEHIDFVSGLTLSIPKSMSDDGIPIISMNSIDKDGVITKEGIRTITLPNKKTINYCKKGDLLFNWRNGSTHLVGKTGYFDFDGEYVFASFLLGIRVKPESFDSKYLWYLLNNYRKEKKYSQLMREGVNGLFNREELKILNVFLPPLSVQKEIVAQIEAEQEMVNANKKLIEIYEQKIKDKIGEVWGEECGR